MSNKLYSKKSWHYWLARNLGGCNSYYSTDICEYSHCVLKGFIAAILISVIFGVGFGAVADFLIWVYVGLFHAWVYPDLVAFGVGVIILILGVVLLGYGFFKVGKDIFPSFIGDAYKSVKNKMCFLIDFE